MVARRILSEDFGGLIAKHELIRAGVSRAHIAAALADGSLLRVRKGWYADSRASAAAVRAARVGGRLTCVSAAREWGLWVPPLPTDLHVAVNPSACQLRDPDAFARRLDGDGVVVHWSRREVSVGRSPNSRVIVDPPSAMRAMCGCLDHESAFILVESALHLRIVGSDEWAGVLVSLPAAVRRALRDAGGLSGSGTESLFALRARRRGLSFRQQVQIGPHRVDFLFGARLVVEVDSRAHHDRESDYARDARLGVLGYRVLRFSYRQVMYAWHEVEAALLAALSRGDHL